ncbi:YdcF family protein [Allocoleopsis sp.]|uniref:YdcF family protein n=1 Tax=Allocoleopsis sp. TaxID=3088169 RepID=UPI002FD45EA6
MFLLLTQVLLWLLITVIIYNLLLKVIPRAYLTLLGGFLLFAIIVLAFFFPNDRLVATAWSILSFPLKPVGATIVLLAAALNQGLKKNLIMAALLILLISSVPIVSTVLARPLELGEVSRPATTAAAPAGAIVVLGQGTTQPSLPPRPQIQLTDEGSNRLRRAAQLYQEQTNRGNQPIIIASAGSEANNVASVLTQFGVPQGQIVTESRSQDLRTSAEQVKDILRSRAIGNRPIFLVTSAINSRRARLAFSQVGIRVITQPANFVSTEPGTREARNITIQSFIPSVDALSVSTRILEEFYTTIYYSLRGWLSPTAT